MSETTSWGDTDPIRKAAEHAAQPKPKRFFKRAEIGTGENGETILLLDDRQARTPAKNVLYAP
ncbi:MAG: ATPase, partial [Pseudomonadota bacterium]